VDVCVVGSANLDLVVTTEHLPRPGETVLGGPYAEYPGGKGLNQAIAAARSGARTHFVGAVGNDDAGTRLLAVLREDGIAHDHVRRVDVPTGRALIQVDTTGENSIVVVPGANALVSADVVPASRVLVAQLEVPLAVVVAAFERSDAIRVLNPAPARDLPDGLLAACDVVVPNQHELERLGGAERLLDAGAGAVVVTLGSEGARLVTLERTVAIDPFEVEPVDSTGAGDAFCGALAARLALGEALEAAARWAAAAGALATTTPGAVPAQPHAAAVERLLAG
jgi:ribokinase